MTNLISKLNLIALLLAAFSFTAREKEDITPIDTPDIIAPPPVPTTTEQIVKVAIPAEDYQDEFDNMVRMGFRPVWIDGFIHRAGVANDSYNKTMFNVIFEKSDDQPKWASYHGLTGASYQAKFNELTNDGYRLEFIESYIQDGGVRYAPIFVKEAGPAWLAVHGKKHSTFQDFFNDKVAQGYRMVNRSIVSVNGTKYVTALFDKKNVGSWLSKSGLTTEKMQTAMEDNKDLGRPLAYLDISQKTSTDYTFGPIFNSEAFNNWYAPNGMDEDELIDEIADAKAAGYHTVLVAAYDEFALINGNEVRKIKYTATFKK
jgi:hypothetical protein